MTRGALAATAAALLLPAAAAAQWRVEAGAGRAIEERVSARVGTTTASVALRYDGAGRWLYLSGGAPLEAGAPPWGAAGGGGWLGGGSEGLAYGVGVGAHGYLYPGAGSIRSGGGLTAEARPGVAASRGPWRLEGRSGPVGVLDLVRDSVDTRAFWDSDGRASFRAAPGVEVAGEGRWLQGRDGGHPYAGASAQAERGRVTAWAFAGRWLRDGFPAPATALGAGASLRVGRGTEVGVSWRQDPADPMYWSLPRRGWNVLLARRLGPDARPRDAAPSPPAAPVAVVVGDTLVLRLPAAAHVEAPLVAGDFTGWSPVVMTRDGSLWTARIPVRPGVHHYGFRTAAGVWFLPPGVPAVDDGFGGTAAVVTVPPPASGGEIHG